MKSTRYLPAIVALLIVFPLQLFSQDCMNHHMDGDCRYDIDKGYSIYSQSKSVTLSPLDTVELNAVFYGQKDYMLSFCTHKKMYPIHFMLYDQDTGQLLYDNEDDKYLESLGIGFDATKSLTIKINVLARQSTEEEIKENVGCVGLLIQYKKYPNKKVKINM